MLSISRSCATRIVARLTTTTTTTTRRALATVATISKDKVPSKDADRLFIEDDGNGAPLRDPILVAKVNDQYYAVHNTCPHMQKSMEHGKIFTNDGPDPILRCHIHNTRFNMRTGKCVKWVTGALGCDNAMAGRVASSIGGAQQDIAAFEVHVNEDGSLSIGDQVKEG